VPENYGYQPEGRIAQIISLDLLENPGSRRCRTGSNPRDLSPSRMIDTEHCPAANLCRDRKAQVLPTTARELMPGLAEKPHVGIGHPSASGRLSNRVSGRYQIQKVWVA